MSCHPEPPVWCNRYWRKRRPRPGVFLSALRALVLVVGNSRTDRHSEWNLSPEGEPALVEVSPDFNCSRDRSGCAAHRRLDPCGLRPRLVSSASCVTVIFCSLNRYPDADFDAIPAPAVRLPPCCSSPSDIRSRLLLRSLACPLVRKVLSIRHGSYWRPASPSHPFFAAHALGTPQLRVRCSS